MQTDGECIISYSWAVDVLNVGEGRTWSDSVTTVDVPLNKIMSSMEINARTMIPGTDNSLKSGLGKVNSSIWRFGGQVYEIGTVLFTGLEADLQSDAVYGLVTAIRCKFVWRELPHNYAWRSDTATYDYTVPLMYESIDFTSLGLI
jgi:hypothetical protein